MSTIDVEDVCTDADLEGYVLGKTNLQNLLPEDPAWLTDPDADYDYDANPRVATIVRQQALDDVLEALAKRRPPIRETDLLDVTELKRPVAFGALHRLYTGQIQHEDSPNVAKAKHYCKAYEGAMAALQPSVLQGATASSLSVRMHRG